MPLFSRLFLLPALIIFAALPGCSPGTPKASKPRIGIINANRNLEQVITGFKEEMVKQGYSGAKNVTYIHNQELSEEMVNGTLDTMIREKVDLILALTTTSAKKAKEATAGSRIPVVFAPVFDAVESGLVNSLAQPGGNLTGVQVGGATSKALGWLVLLFPEIKTIYVPSQSGNKGSAQSLHDLQTEADKRHLRLIVAPVATPEELSTCLEQIPPEADALWILNAPLVVGHLELVTPAAVKRRLPVATSTGQYKNGILLSYGQDHYRTGMQAAHLASKILRGTPPAELPVETSDYFLGINLQTALALGIKIPDEILHQADFIAR